MALEAERVESVGAGPRRIAPKFTLNPGYSPESSGGAEASDGLRSSGCFCVRFSPDDQYLAASFSNGAIHVYNTQTGKQEFVLNRPAGAGDSGGSAFNSSAALPTTQVRWRPHTAQSKTKNVLISVNAETDGQVLHWHIKSGKCLHTITESGNQIFCLDYFRDGSLFGTAGKDRLLRVYDEATKRQICTLEGGDLKNCAGHSNRVFSLKFHPQHPSIILSGGWDNTVQVWDTRKGHSVRSFWNCYLCGDAVDISSDGEQLLTGSWRIKDSLQVWDFGSGELIESIPWCGQASAKSDGGPEPPSSMLFAAQMSRDPGSSLVMAGGTQGNEARLFDRTAGKSECFGAIGLPKPCFSVDFAQQSNMAAVGAADGIVRVVDIL